jgi:hypothetical protein
MTDFMTEVKDDMRQQQLAAFWKENAPWIIGGCLLAIVMTGGLTFWRGYEAKSNMQQTAQLVTALRSGDVEKLSGYAETGKSDHAAFARFAEAQLYAQKSDKAKAIAIYNAVSDDGGVSREWRDLAKLQAIAQRFDTESADTLRADLKQLSKKSVWRFTAQEMSALLYARENKMAEAADVMQKLSADRSAPDDVRTRAATLAELYAGISQQ